MSNKPRKAKSSKKKLVSAWIEKDIHDKFAADAQKNNRSMSGEFRNRLKLLYGN